VSGLPKHLTQQDLERMFSSCGAIITSRILCDNISGHKETPIFLKKDITMKHGPAIPWIN